MTATEIRVDRATAGRPAPRPSQHPWLWLGLGTALLPFTTFQDVIPLAAWLAPIFLLRFVRLTRARVGIPVVAVAGYLATVVAMRDVFPGSGQFLWAIPGLAAGLVYGADKMTGRHLPPLLRTLAFPAADTALAFLAGMDRASAFGSWGASGYTQAGSDSLIQMTSVFGIWGLGFLIMWTASVVNEVWEQGFQLKTRARLVAGWSALVCTVLAFGGVQLAFFPPGSQAVTVAALAPDLDLDLERDQRPDLTPANRQAVTDGYLEPVIADLFDRSRIAADSGAKIVAWAEAAAYVLEEDEQAFLERASRVAAEEQIYLETGIILILSPGADPSNENRSLLWGPDGQLLWDYEKSTEVLGDGNRPGPGLVPFADTPYGRLAGIICFDADFPALVRQAGRGGADILLVPSSDWDTIAEVHNDMAVFRAVENGVSIVRPTRRGISSAVDFQGRTLAVDPDPFTGDNATLLADVPTEGRTTPYAALFGDVVAWASVLGVLVFSVAAVVWRVRSRRTGRTM